MDKFWETGQQLLQHFIYFRQAYDSINRESLRDAMAELGKPNKYIYIATFTPYVRLVLR